MDPSMTGTEPTLLAALERFLDSHDYDVEVVMVDGRYTVQIVRTDDRAGSTDPQSTDAIRNSSSGH
jgi:hypothetical protein